MRSNPFMPVGPYGKHEDASKSLSDYVGAGAGMLRPIATAVATAKGGPIAGAGVSSFMDYLSKKLQEDDEDDRKDAARAALGMQ